MFMPLQDFGGGDVDYRTAPKKEESGSAIRSLGNNSPMMAPPGNYVKKTSSPQKSNASKFQILNPHTTAAI